MLRLIHWHALRAPPPGVRLPSNAIATQLIIVVGAVLLVLIGGPSVDVYAGRSSTGLFVHPPPKH